MSRLTAIGLMSGTSYDGVDVALIETDGEEIGNLGPTGYRPYSEQERDVLRRAIAAERNHDGALLGNDARQPAADHARCAAPYQPALAPGSGMAAVFTIRAALLL